jgi:hypothetical protein
MNCSDNPENPEIQNSIYLSVFLHFISSAGRNFSQLSDQFSKFAEMTNLYLSISFEKLAAVSNLLLARTFTHKKYHIQSSLKTTGSPAPG